MPALAAQNRHRKSPALNLLELHINSIYRFQQNAANQEERKANNSHSIHQKKIKPAQKYHMAMLVILVDLANRIICNAGATRNDYPGNVGLANKNHGSASKKTRNYEKSCNLSLH
ncbi:hypothetical protein NG827_13455 [Xanthomonas sacchari]|uniref:hypothetical protein n=1 Tax=Xanthomonas sacchari TaxID=56458 RepID=UPI002255460D|nr:hypothetical protein [Xanthomonas sacchari]UYK83479.1 hypothetical protein NG827_13455 [Xanthomonas sacchari]